jgi:hypothetical protein
MLLGLALGWTLLRPATADGAGTADAADAFDYGLAEMLAGRYATGCPAIESSFRLDPRPGTLFTLADCNRKWGRTASALARFDEFLALYERMPDDQRSKQRERAAVATSERAALQKSVPLLAIRLSSEAPAGTRVWRDDVELPAPMLGAPVPVDPGEHVILVRAPDGRAQERRVVLAEGEQHSVVAELPQGKAPVPSRSRGYPLELPDKLGSLRYAPRASAPPPAAQGVAAAPATEASAPAPTAQPASRQGWLYAAAGVGGAALVVAAVGGIAAVREKAIASPVCDAHGLCSTQQGVDAGNQAHALADVATGAFVAAAVALSAALVLWWLEPRRQGAPGAGPVVWRPDGAAAVW